MIFLQKISTHPETHESGLHHEYLGREKIGIDSKSGIIKLVVENLENTYIIMTKLMGYHLIFSVKCIFMLIYDL